MTLSMVERIQEIRQEIAEITRHGVAFSRGGRRDRVGTSEQEERVLRLERIKSELTALGARKKV
jgi:hypothetical protein